MPDDLSHVACARLASGLTINDAALVTGMSPQEYERIESRPLEFTVGELRALCRELNVDGRKFMGAWINSFFGL